MNVTALLAKQRKATLIGLGFFLFLLVALGDYLTSPGRFDFSAFYVLPIAFFAWFMDRRSGIISSVAGVLVSLAVHLSRGLEISSKVFYWNAFVRFGLFVVVTLLVSEIKVLYRKECELSRVDDLTHIPNRRAFYEFLAAEQSRASREGKPFTLAYIDVDQFKQVNDTLGHASGDELLRVAAQTMRHSLRQMDHMARMGGDEFAILLPGTDFAASATALHSLQATLNGVMQQHRWPVTFSIGAVTFCTAPVSTEQIFQTADKLMYSAKRSGRGRIVQEVWATLNQAG